MSISLHPALLREAFIYFSKYPALQGVISTMFGSGSVDTVGYAELKAQLAALNPNSLVPEILNFLFSSNEDKLKKEIEDTKGIFMLLDYGQMTSSRDSLKRNNDQFEMGIIIARKIKPEQYDMAETLLIQDELLNTMRKVRQQMIIDQFDHPFMKHIDFPHTISPWYARELCNATGFSLMFNRTGIDLI